jgi:hypothetical protein
MKTVLGIVDSEGFLEQAIGALQDAGFASESVTIVNPDGNPNTVPTSGRDTGFLSRYTRRTELVREGDALFYVQSCADVRSIQPGEHLVVVRTADEHAQRATNVLGNAGVQGVKLCTHAEKSEVQVDIALPIQDRLSNTLCWTARLFGLVLIGVVLSFFIGEGLIGGDMPDLLAMGLAEELLMLALLTTLVGMILGWHWEGIGGLTIVVGVLLFEGIDLISSGSLSISPLNPLFLLVAMLFLLDWRRNADRGWNNSHEAISRELP